ncbi:cupin-like domain-containing protein [Robbsia andropogonis]|uniref:cupin-like domain-containing protein n=1 Tax=Robbsia andropogonis TaxID=28092 RepID=UPI003D217A7A
MTALLAGRPWGPDMRTSRTMRFPVGAERAITSQETPTLSARLDDMCARLNACYVPPVSPAIVELCILSGRARQTVCFVFGDRISIKWNIENASITDEVPSGAARSTITLVEPVFAMLLDAPDRFDPRHPDCVALGGIRIDQTPWPAAYFLQLLKRPSVTQRDALQRAVSRAPFSLSAVDQRGCGSATRTEVEYAVHDAIAASRPLVLRNLLRWPETRWTVNDWRDREAQTALGISVGGHVCRTVKAFIDACFPDSREGLRDNDIARDPAATAGWADSALSPGAAATRVRQPLYTGGCALPPQWEERFAMPLFSPKVFGPAQWWFGAWHGDALATRLHCDTENSFLAQLMGRKRIRLYGPAQAALLYAMDAFNAFRPCRVDVQHPDLVRFPEFTKARGVDVLIEPGDLLVIPTGWFHCVWAIDDTMSISRFLSDLNVRGRDTV